MSRRSVIEPAVVADSIFGEFRATLSVGLADATHRGLPPQIKIESENCLDWAKVKEAYCGCFQESLVL